MFMIYIVFFPCKLGYKTNVAWEIIWIFKAGYCSNGNSMVKVPNTLSNFIWPLLYCTIDFYITLSPTRSPLRYGDCWCVPCKNFSKHVFCVSCSFQCHYLQTAESVFQFLLEEEIFRWIWYIVLEYFNGIVIRVIHQDWWGVKLHHPEWHHSVLLQFQFGITHFYHLAGSAKIIGHCKP